MEHDKEDGEMSDDTEMLGNDVKETFVDEENKCTVLYKADKEGLVVKKLTRIDASKLEERAQRFGINLTGNRIVTQKQIDELYYNFGVESRNERHFRFDTLHLNGVHGLSTKDIFEYLQEYKPVSLEWVDDNSCNVVCQDHISVALALLVHSREIKSEEIRKMLMDKSSYHWREGFPHPKTDMILMRFATNSDKKSINKSIPEKNIHYNSDYNDGMKKSIKNPWGDLCRSWGVYDHQEIFQRKFINTYDKYDEDSYDEGEPPKRIMIKNEKLAKRLGKRFNNYDDDDSSSSDTEWKKKPKAPRMRMHADDEETKIKKTKALTDEKDEFAPLSIEVINCRSNFTPRNSNIVSERFQNHRKKNDVSVNIQSRLGSKVAPERNYHSSEGSSSDSSDHYVMSRVQKVSSSSNNTSSVWSRLDTEANNSRSNKDLRQFLKTRKTKTNDLRERLSKSKQSNLRIEIDNNYLSE